MPDPIISIPWADDSMTVLDFNKVKVNGELAVDLLAERDKLRDLLSIAKAALEKARPIEPPRPGTRHLQVGGEGRRWDST